MNSCRFSEHSLPVRVSQSIAVAHSCLRRLDVAHEAVQVLDQRLHDLAQARIGDVLPALQRHVGEVVFGYVGHGHLLEAVDRLAPCHGEIRYWFCRLFRISVAGSVQIGSKLPGFHSALLPSHSAFSQYVP